MQSVGSVLAVTAVVLLALPSLARSQAPPGDAAKAPAAARVLTLDQAIAVAAESNPVLAAARRRAAAASEGALATRRGVTWPRLGFANTWTATDTPATVFAQKLNAGLFGADDFAIDSLNSPSARSHLSSSLALEYPIDAFGKSSPSTGAASASADAMSERAREVELEVRLRVVEAWHRAAVATHAVVATERAAAGAAAREAQIEAQMQGGAALRADLLRARARRRSLEADLAARRGEAQAAAAGLALAVGSSEPVAPARDLPPDQDATVATDAGTPDPQALPAAGGAEIGPLDAWLEHAADRPAVAAARAALVAAEQGSLVAARTLRPDLALAAQLQDDRGPLSQGQTTGAAGVYLRWSLFDPQREASRAAADLSVAAAAADLAAALAQTRFEIESAWYVSAAAGERWQAARGGTEEGREALRVVRERRAAGLATLTDELETEAAALAAELAELSAAADAAVSGAALERAAGVGFLRAEANRSRP
jgi:cobalt-zinc-cadmium efflux system outer membrane protein